MAMDPDRGANGLHRTGLAVAIVLLHLFVAPCATAMGLMSANADCGHCQVVDGSQACTVASGVSTSVIENVAFDSESAVSSSSVLPWLANCPGPFAVALAAEFASRTFTSRRSGDPPLWLLLGQLRL